MGLDSVDPASARRLAIPEDPATCAKLREELPEGHRVEGRSAPWAATYYQVDDRYVVVREKKLDESAGSVEIVPPMTLVYDGEYRLLGRIIN